jgi:hypothetical protein
MRCFLSFLRHAPIGRRARGEVESSPPRQKSNPSGLAEGFLNTAIGVRTDKQRQSRHDLDAERNGGQPAVKFTGMR